jgi:branched-chain amino acid transport system substrate-binding protein
MCTRLSLVFVVLVAVVALAACGLGGEPYQCTDEWGCATFEPGQTIKIAFVGPYTGDYSNYGVDMSRGAELAVKDHPTVKGFEIALVIEDTQGLSEQGAAVANKLVADPQIVGIDGHSFSGSTEVAIPIYDEAGIVMMSPSATNATLTKLGSAVFNRVAFGDGMQGEYAAKYIYETLGLRKIAVMHDGGTYGQGLAETTAEVFEELGGEVVAIEAITPGETDYRPPLAAVAASGPELIYYGGYDADAAVLVTQMAKAGLEGTKFFGCDGTRSLTYLELAGEAADGTFAAYVPIPESGAFEEFRQDYFGTYNEEQGILSPFSPHSYDATAILINAVEAVAIEHGDNLIVPRKALADQVRGTEGYQGLTGEITCSETGECAAASIVFVMAENGEWVTGPGQ